MNAPFHDPAKNFAINFVERNERAFITLNDSIFYFGELGVQETRTAGLMTSILEQHGFTVQRGISGFATSFMATYGSGAPVIAIHTEYDANPSNSQKPGVAERAEIVADAPGHCEGHNTNAAVMITSALAIRHAMEKYKLPGTLKIFGASAEEQLLSRPYFVRDGFFDDVDLAFHDHVLDEFGTDYGIIQSAAISAEFTFRGETAHAAVSPWKGRDALDAVVLMDVGLAQYREHMKPTMTMHRVITKGGEQPNVIPALAACWWYFRDPTAEGARVLFERAQKIAQGAAMMANCELSVDVRAAVWPVRLNQTIAEVIQRNVEAIGMPVWTEEENIFARKLQQQAKMPEIGLRPEISALDGPAVQIAASNDCGDVSWKVPMGRLWFPGNVPHLPFHHWSAGAALATSIAHKGGVAGAKALATSVIEYFQNTDLVVQTKDSFKNELGGVSYKPLLPDDQRAPAHLNQALMDKFRPAMEAHYVKAEPVFTLTCKEFTMPSMRYPRKWEWPNQAKIAMTVNLAMEAFRFKSQYTQEGRPGRVDHFSISYARYGANSGIYRILDLLDETGTKGSISLNGRAAELYPDQIRAITDAGHEPVGHGWENDVLSNEDDPDAELNEIRRVTKAITDAGGVRPIGWTSPGSAGSANTLSFLAGEGFLWNGDEADDDLPYVKDTKNGAIVLLPRVNTPTNDLSIWINGKNPPSVIWEQFKDTFDELYSEGERGHPKWVEIVLHAHMAGRPTLIPTIRKCIAYAKDHGDVWFARKRDLAEWAMKREKPGA